MPEMKKDFALKHLTVNPERHKELKLLAQSEGKMLHRLVDEVLEKGMRVYVQGIKASEGSATSSFSPIDAGAPVR